MAETRILIAAEAGVRLERVERLSGQQRSALYKLSTFRPPQPRFIADQVEAQEAFAREVSASLKDPVVIALMERGAI